jgi:hypothetical protein
MISWFRMSFQIVGFPPLSVKSCLQSACDVSGDCHELRMLNAAEEKEEEEEEEKTNDNPERR